MREQKPDIDLICGCPTLPENGDMRCHVCREYVNVRCWNCKTPRGEGMCPNLRPAPTTGREAEDA